MRKIKKRLLNIQLPPNRSAFLWGPRKTGITYWINTHFSGLPRIDLLKTDVFAEYASRPSLLRERFVDHHGLVVIDEIQMVPDLLNEIHWMIENTHVSFLMTGSSARKLKRGHANLLAGRAWRYTMTPLSYTETEGFDLEDVFISGLLPPHFDIRYWRTSTGFEVDFILGEMEVAIETKASRLVHSAHTRAIRALCEEHRISRAIIVSLEKHPRTLEPGLQVLPWQDFLERVWAGELGV